MARQQFRIIGRAFGDLDQRHAHFRGEEFLWVGGSDWNMGYKLTGDIGYSGVGLEGVGSCFVLVFSLACWTAQVEWGSGWLRA